MNARKVGGPGRCAHCGHVEGHLLHDTIHGPLATAHAFEPIPSWRDMCNTCALPRERHRPGEGHAFVPQPFGATRVAAPGVAPDVLRHESWSSQKATDAYNARTAATNPGPILQLTPTWLGHLPLACEVADVWRAWLTDAGVNADDMPAVTDQRVTAHLAVVLNALEAATRDSPLRKVKP